MSKPFATAIVANVFSGYSDAPVEVRIIKSKARHCEASFYAPGWRPMAFRTAEAAIAKISRHPGFIRFLEA